MASTFYLEILTPERRFFTGDVEMIIFKTIDGEMGILPGHIPMVVPVSIGPIKIKKDGEWVEAVLTEGFMEIKQKETIVLVDTAEWPHEIDVNRAKAALERAEERLHSKMAHMEYIRSQAALSRAMTRLKVKRHYR